MMLHEKKNYMYVFFRIMFSELGIVVGNFFNFATKCRPSVQFIKNERRVGHTIISPQNMEGFTTYFQLINSRKKFNLYIYVVDPALSQFSIYSECLATLFVKRSSNVPRSSETDNTA